MSQVIGQLFHPEGMVQMLVRPQARRITLRLDHTTREAVLVLPHKRYQKQAEKLLTSRKDWLREQWQSLPPPMPFVDGGDILLYGQGTKLIFQKGRGQAKHTEQGLVVFATQEHAFAGRVRRALIALARERLHERAEYHAQNLRVSLSRITVRDTRSRWGSCSASGNLNFSWRLICAPDFVLDYVAAHEVAHLIHANHSANFWDEVKTTFGSPAAPRKYLREYSPQLFAIGFDH